MMLAMLYFRRGNLKVLKMWELLEQDIGTGMFRMQELLHQDRQMSTSLHSVPEVSSGCSNRAGIKEQAASCKLWFSSEQQAASASGKERAANSRQWTADSGQVNLLNGLKLMLSRLRS